MDNLSIKKKEKCISSALEISALECIEVTDETKNEIQAWLRGEETFLEVFETMLLKYGFQLI